MATIHKQYTTGSSSSGAWSANTDVYRGVTLEHVVIQAATAGTTFDFSLTNEDSVVVKSWIGVTDELNDQVYIPLVGKYTMSIANATNDPENFKILLMIDEA